jgi:hypothetical protein
MLEAARFAQVSVGVSVFTLEAQGSGSKKPPDWVGNKTASKVPLD